MTERNNMMLRAAVAGILGAAVVAAPAGAQDKPAKKKHDLVKCYGVNKCKGFGKCAGKGHECAGTNSCKGQGWLLMPKDSCAALDGGTTTAPADTGTPAQPAQPTQPAQPDATGK